MDARVLVVDDNSPDGTGEIAERLAAELFELRLEMQRVRDRGPGEDSRTAAMLP